jgi:poly(A) polymerase Pap1
MEKFFEIKYEWNQPRPVFDPIEPENP